MPYLIRLESGHIQSMFGIGHLLLLVYISLGIIGKFMEFVYQSQLVI